MGYAFLFQNNSILQIQFSKLENQKLFMNLKYRFIVGVFLKKRKFIFYFKFYLYIIFSCLFIVILIIVASQKSTETKLQQTFYSMINQNPYNLPDRVLKQTQVSKPIISLQNKKSRDRSNQYSRQSTSKGIKLESHMKKSAILQHVTSSPNLQNTQLAAKDSLNSSNNISLDNVHYHPQNSQHLQLSNLQPKASQQYEEKKIKYLNQKIILMSQQLLNHQKILNKLQNNNNQKMKLSQNISQAETYNSSTTNKQSHEKAINGSVNLIIQRMSQDIQQIKEELLQTRETDWNQKNSIRKSAKSQNTSTKQLLLINQSIEQFQKNSIERFGKIQNCLQNYQHRTSSIHQRIDLVESSIQRHMDVVNKQINTALSKIVSSINEKVAKALDNNKTFINQKIQNHVQQTKKSIDMQIKNAKITEKKLPIQGIKILKNQLMISGYKSVEKGIALRHLSYIDISSAQHNAHLSNNQSDNIHNKRKIMDCLYYVDKEGYLMDQDQNYLMDSNNNLFKLGTEELQKLDNIHLA